MGLCVAFFLFFLFGLPHPLPRKPSVNLLFSLSVLSFAGEKMSAKSDWFQSSRAPSFAQMLKKNLPVQPSTQKVTTSAGQATESYSLSNMASKVTPVTGRSRLSFVVAIRACEGPGVLSELRWASDFGVAGVRPWKHSPVVVSHLAPIGLGYSVSA